MCQKQKGGSNGRTETLTNLDGAYFGMSFPQIFCKTYPLIVEMSPKIYLYEPKICGFNIVGQRGSKYYNPQAQSAYAPPVNKATIWTK